MLTFSTQPAEKMGGKLIYRESEYSFDFVEAEAQKLSQRRGSKGVSSISVDTLQIEIGIEHGEVLYVWGFYPIPRKVVDLPLPVTRSARVFTHGERWDLGISVPIPWSHHEATFDPRRRVTRITSSEKLADEYVTPASGIIFGLIRDQVSEIILSAKFEE